MQQNDIHNLLFENRPGIRKLVKEYAGENGKLEHSGFRLEMVDFILDLLPPEMSDGSKDFKPKCDNCFYNKYYCELLGVLWTNICRECSTQVQEGRRGYWAHLLWGRDIFADKIMANLSGRHKIKIQSKGISYYSDGDLFNVYAMYEVHNKVHYLSWYLASLDEMEQLWVRKSSLNLKECNCLSSVVI